jgi:hypothetical protein
MTGYASPGAGPHTGPAILNAPPPGSGATAADLPVSGSTTEMLCPSTYAISPAARAPATGEGLCVPAGVLGPHALKITARISGAQPRFKGFPCSLRA